MNIKTLSCLFLAFGLLFWSGCKDDDDSVITTLNYDGPNFTAPFLPPGTNYFAAYFPPSETQRYQGRMLDRVSFYVSQIPLSTSVVIFGEGPNDRTPGAELYRKDITARINNTGWAEDRILPGIEITGDGIWLAIEVELADGAPQSIGCDQGQNYNSNGDLLLLATNPNNWASFNNINGETVNWNIRGILAEQ